MVFALRQFAQSVFGNCDNTPLPPPEASFLFENAQVRNWAQGTRFPVSRSLTRSFEWLLTYVATRAGQATAS